MSVQHTNLTLIREWLDTDEPEPEDGWRWPHPPEMVEFRVDGQMRSDVLAKIGRDPADPIEVRLVHGTITGGYSEYTVEMDYEIEVWLHEDNQQQRIYQDDSYSDEVGLPNFLRWLTGEREAPR